MDAPDENVLTFVYVPEPLRDIGSSFRNAKTRQEAGRMSDKTDFIDLPPHEWRSEREKPKEPFWGPGWPEALAYLVGLSAVVIITHLTR